MSAHACELSPTQRLAFLQSLSYSLFADPATVLLALQGVPTAGAGSRCSTTSCGKAWVEAHHPGVTTLVCGPALCSWAAGSGECRGLHT